MSPLLLPSLASSVGSAALAALLAVAPTGDEVDPLTRAIEMFKQSEPEIRASILTDIRAAVEASEDEGVKRLLRLGERARKELKTKPWPGLEYFEPKKYAPAFPREFVPKDGDLATATYDQMRPWDNEPRCFGVRVRYDYAKNRGVDLGVAPADENVLTDFLWGYPPEPDRTIAWIEQKLDFANDLDDLADYFGHAYRDREGACFPNVTLYDVWASQGEFGHIEMPDGDAIAYAIHLLGDKSYHSPIPADRRRTALYDKVSQGFLKVYRHRSWVEAAANVYLNPEAVIRTDHENLRERLWSSFGVHEDDVVKVAAEFEKGGSRGAWIDAIDAMHDRDKKTYYRGHRWREERNATRWVIAEAAYAVLREYGLLYD